MGFLERLKTLSGITRRRGRSAVLIDINSDSVAGAYAWYEEEARPILLYTKRLFIESRTREPEEETMTRTLQILSETLVREGGSALVRTVGNGRVDHVLVSIDAPWQKTFVRTEHFEQKTPFVFTKRLVSAALEKIGSIPSGKMLVDETVVGTILNGYETREPYGKHANRASVIILTSLIDERVARKIHSVISGLYRAKDIRSIAASSLHYQAMRSVFPHDRDILVINVSRAATSISLVHGGFLIEVLEIPIRTIDIRTWQKTILSECARLAEKSPLPHTVFLLAPESGAAAYKEALDGAGLGALWLSDNPPTIVPLLARHLSEFVQQRIEVVSDTMLLLMVLFCGMKGREIP